MTTAFVLSGGGSLGAVHGTSSESLVGLADVWGSLRRHDAFPVDLRSAVRGLLGRRSAICSPVRLGELVAACAGDAMIEEARFRCTW